MKKQTKLSEVIQHPLMRAICIFTVGVLLLLWLMAFYGCSSYHEKLRSIPYAEFASFEYHRGGNFSSADIVALDSALKDGVLTIGSVSFVENWGPFFSLNISLKGYKRQVKDFIEQPLRSE